jgi:hypothetical protein
MKFLCLGYYNEKAFSALSEAEVNEVVRDCPIHDAALYATGKVIAVASLAATKDSTSIRPRNGRPWITDGPFAETKEQIGAFFIIEAADMAEAVEIASKHPAALLGESVGWGVEIRPIDQEDIFSNA